MTLGKLFQDLRSSRTGLAVTVAVLLSLLVIAVLWVLPGLAEERAAQAIAARTGLEMEAGSVSVSLGGVSFDDVVLGARGGGAHITLKSLTVDASLWALPLSGAAAVERIEARRVRADLNVEGPAYHGLMASRAARPSDGSSAGTQGKPRRRPPVVVHDLQLVMSDDRGLLVEVDAKRAKLGGGTAEVFQANLQVGSASEPAVDLGGLSIGLTRRVAGGLSLKSCAVAQATVRLSQDREAAIHPAQLRRRFRRALHPESSDQLANDQAASQGPGEEKTAPDEAQPLDGEKAGDGLPRAAAVPKADGSSDRATADDDTEGGPASAGPDRGFGLDPFEWLAVGANCEVDEAEVLSVGAGARHVLMTGLSGTLEHAEEGVLALKASGRGEQDGRLDADLSMSRDPLRIDGKVRVQALPLSLVAPLLPAIPWHEPGASRIDARLTVATRSVSEVAAQGNVRLRAVAIDSPRVAPEPVVFDELTFSGAARFLPLQRRLEVDEAAASTGGAQALLSGAIEWAPDHYVLNLDVEVPRAACDDVIKSAPAALLGEMAEASWSGRISGGVKLRLDSRDLDATELELDVADGCDFVTVPAMADLRRFRMPFVHSVLEPDGQIFEMQTGPGTMQWAYIEDISPFFVHAVLAHEDAQFFNHAGFSPFHIRNALVRNLKEGRYVVGASTITMQLVKNIFLHREKTLARKVQEALLTWWIERVMDKRDILELYLNVIEYGPAVYGIKHASDYYFKRLPSNLSPAESVFLSTILPAPKRYHSFYEKGGLSSGWKDRMRSIFRRMRSRSWYSEEAVSYGLAELERFHFVRPGQTPAPRTIPGTTAPLPYQQINLTGSAWDTLFNSMQPGSVGDGMSDEN